MVMKSEAELGETAHCCTVCKVTHLPLALENSLALKGHLENNNTKPISIITIKLQLVIREVSTSRHPSETRHNHKDCVS